MASTPMSLDKANAKSARMDKMWILLFLAKKPKHILMRWVQIHKAKMILPKIVEHKTSAKIVWPVRLEKMEFANRVELDCIKTK